LLDPRAILFQSNVFAAMINMDATILRSQPHRGLVRCVRFLRS
jgi:hypothetical protein